MVTTDATNLIAHLSILYTILHHIRQHTKVRDYNNERNLNSLADKGMIKIGAKPDGTKGKTYKLSNRAILFIDRMEEHINAIAIGSYDYANLKILLR